MLRRRIPSHAALVALTLAAAADATTAQEAPRTFHACYVPASGTVYRIRETGLRSGCHAPSHVEFSWTEGLDAQALKSGDAAGGDLAGTYPAPEVARLRGRAIAGTAPASGQVLAWDGSAWVPVTPAAGVTSHGALSGLGADDHPQYLLVDPTTRALAADLAAAGRRITGLPTANAAGEPVVFQQAVKVADAAAGDLAGSYPAPVVAALQGRPLAATAPTADQVLAWNAASQRWEPRTPAAAPTPAVQVAAAARVRYDGVLLGLSHGDVRVTYAGPGMYRITFAGYRQGPFIVTATPDYASVDGSVGVVRYDLFDIEIVTRDGAGNLADRGFSFIVHQINP